MGNISWTKLTSRKKKTCPRQELQGQQNCCVLGLAAKRLEGYLITVSVCVESGHLGHSLSGHLLWNSDLDVNVVVSIAIAINPGDAFPRQANLLVCLNPSRDLLKKECTDITWSPLSKNKAFHYTEKGIFKEGFAPGVQNNLATFCVDARSKAKRLGCKQLEAGMRLSLLPYSQGLGIKEPGGEPTVTTGMARGMPKVSIPRG